LLYKLKTPKAVPVTSSATVSRVLLLFGRGLFLSPYPRASESDFLWLYENLSALICKEPTRWLLESIDELVDGLPTLLLKILSSVLFPTYTGI